MASKQARLAQLEERIQAPDFWDDPQGARALMKERARLQDEVNAWAQWEQRWQDAYELAEMGDPDLAEELEAEVAALEQELRQRELQAMLSGPYDRHNALLSIHAGAGGTDAHDWAEMLLRMYLRWAEKRGYETEIWTNCPVKRPASRA